MIAAKSALSSRKCRAVWLVGALILPQSALPTAAQPSDQAYNTAKRLAATMERCWFAPGETDFAGYVYSPEPNATGGPRILIVPRGSPHELPALVVELKATDGQVTINAYGPMATSAKAERIGADLRRWLAGGDGCK